MAPSIGPPALPAERPGAAAEVEPLVTIAIANWNGLPHLRTCLPAVLGQERTAFEVVVVDNGSQDGSRPWLEEMSAGEPRLRLVLNNRNLGFATATNQAIRTSRARYVATLNNDARPAPGWVAALIGAAEADPQVGSAASCMVLHARPTMIDAAGISVDRAGIAWNRLMGEPVENAIPQRPVGIGAGSGASADSQLPAPYEVFGACAGAALYRRALLDDVGLFDERYFMYLEDVDLAWRARLAGWRCLFVPAAVVCHVHSASAVEGSPLKNFHLGRNKLWTIAKNYPTPWLWWYLPAIVGYDIGSLPYTMWKTRDLSPLRGRLAALAGLGPILRDRRAVQSRRRISHHRLMHWMEPLQAPHRLFARYARVRRMLRGS